MDEYIGMVRLFAGNFAPKNWAFCNGALIPIAQNTALFSILGVQYGGDGRTNFALPDLRSKVLLGAGMGAGPGLPNFNIGQTGGEVAHTLVTNEMPAHTHNFNVSSANATQSAATSSAAIAAPGMPNGRSFESTLGFNATSPKVTLNPASVSVIGAGQAHNNMQPFLGLNYIICLYGTFPPRS